MKAFASLRRPARGSRALCFGLVPFGLISATAAVPLAAHAQRHSPYAGQEERVIKALSADEVRALLAGEGMGLARAAELNGVPGPRHVLDLGDALGLGPDQWRRVRRIHASMRSRAIALGERIVELEREMDRGFADGTIEAARVETLARQIGEARGLLRAVHLNAHLETAKILRPEQIRHYVGLRGYAGHGAHGERSRQRP